MLLLAEAAGGARAGAVVADAPPGASLTQGLKRLGELGYLHVCQDCLTTQFGDRVAKNRVLILATRLPMPQDRLEAAQGTLGEHVQTRAERLGSALLPLEAVDDALWMEEPEWEIHWNSRIATTGNPLLPRPVGKAHHLASGAVSLIYDAEGPGSTPRGPECTTGWPGMLILDSRGGPPRCRRLSPLELWSVAGGTAKAWDAALEAGLTVEDLAVGAARMCPAATASVMTRAGEALLREPTARAGVGPDPEEDVMRDRLGRWLSAWEESPLHPGPLYLRDIEQAMRDRAAQRLEFRKILHAPVKFIDR